MFKDYDKYLSASLKVYLFLLMCCFILKIVGFNYFGLDVNDKTLVNISNFLVKTRISDLIIMVMIYIQFYLYLCMVCKKRKLYSYTLLGVILNLIVQAILVNMYKLDWIYYICSFLIMIVIPMMVNKSYKIKEQIKYLLLMSFYQLICLIVRNIGVNENYDNYLVDWLLSFDQVLMLLITYNLVFMKGGYKLCLEQIVGYFSQMKKNFLNLLKKLQRNFSSFKELNKEEKATYIIYFTLSLFWNLFTIVTVIFIAKLNKTLIECIFILSSFWLSKKMFGKAFHLKSMIQCFILSNLTYYILNRITLPIGISIVVPICLGVGLSYVTSKLVRKSKPLYKGMPEKLFDETILQVTDKESIKYKVCYDFFINNVNAVYLGRKYNYTEAGIRKITSRINDSIKALK